MMRFGVEYDGGDHGHRFLPGDETRVGFDFDPVVEGGKGRVFPDGTTVNAQLVRVGNVGDGLNGRDGFGNVFFRVVVRPG